MSQDQFNIKKFLKENQSGPYGVIKKTSTKKKSNRSLNENYIDLMPVGGGNTFKGYTNDLREDETYLGPKKPAPNKIYAEPEADHEQEVKDNAWMHDIDGEQVGEFIVNYEYPGIITWDKQGADQDMFFAATPKWDNQPGTPIEAIFAERNPDQEMIYSEKQDEFGSFEEYAETVYPIIKQWMDQNNHEEMEEGSSAQEMEGEQTYQFGKETLVGTGTMKTFGANTIMSSWHPNDSKRYSKVEPGLLFKENKTSMSRTSRLDDSSPGKAYVVVNEVGNGKWECELLQPSLKEWGAEDGPWPADDIEDDFDGDRRFWEVGGRELAAAVESLLEDGFHLQDIIGYIKEMTDSSKDDDMPY